MSECSMNLFSRHSRNILIINIGREGFGVFGGLKTAPPAHRLIAVRDRLNDMFGNNRVIGLGHDVEWPPRSTDITPCDFFCRGTLKIRYFQLFSTLYEISQRDVHRRTIREKVKVLSLPETIKEKSTFRAKTIRREHR